MNKQNKIPQMFSTFNTFRDYLLISNFHRFAELSTKREPIRHPISRVCRKAPTPIDPSQDSCHLSCTSIRICWLKQCHLASQGKQASPWLLSVLADFFSCVPIKKPRDIVGFLSLGAARKNAWRLLWIIRPIKSLTEETAYIKPNDSHRKCEKRSK